MEVTLEEDPFYCRHPWFHRPRPLCVLAFASAYWIAVCVGLALYWDSGASRAGGLALSMPGAAFILYGLRTWLRNSRRPAYERARLTFPGPPGRVSLAERVRWGYEAGGRHLATELKTLMLAEDGEILARAIAEDIAGIGRFDLLFPLSEVLADNRGLTDVRWLAAEIIARLLPRMTVHDVQAVRDSHLYEFLLSRDRWDEYEVEFALRVLPEVARIADPNAARLLGALAGRERAPEEVRQAAGRCQILLGEALAQAADARGLVRPADAPADLGKELLRALTGASSNAGNALLLRPRERKT